ncbi:MAG: NADH-quinone oxidoreductase subunit L [Actinomycetota bacterium]
MNLTVPLILAVPLAGAVILLLYGKRVGKAAGTLASLAVAGAFGASVVSFINLISLDEGSRSIAIKLFDWARIGSFDVSFTLRWDPLAATMCMVVTGVGFLIHLYSTGYMHDDPRYPRFFAYLNLFVFSMLLLVLADNLVFLYAGWELVGACSYFLIGFWFEKPSAASAAKKAFITTRIGDTGMLIGIFVITAAVGSVELGAINRAAHEGSLAHTTATVAALLLFAGAVGKSAQLPLYVWLPDAMEGPTPVSALIHAATMVTAGVYLVVRLNPLFFLSEEASTVVAIIGAATALYAAILAMAEDDIKRVLAYSTISQLGFMFLAAGVHAYGAAMFHLVTHAFFKGLLFLGAGSVMHALGSETALDRMGGLRKEIPRTFLVVATGWGAITGFVPFAGFFSKDSIMASVWAEGRTGLFVVAATAAALTAFYMSRMFFLAFFGKPRWSEGTHPHESPTVMIAPMAVLAVLSVIGGALNLPAGLPRAGMLDRFLAPVIGVTHPHEGLGVLILMWALAAVAVLGAWWIYGTDLERRAAVRSRLGPVNSIVRQRFFVDEIYATVIVAPLRLLASFFAGVVDRRVIDGFVNNLAGGFSRGAEVLRNVQTGLVRSYAVGIFAGAALVVLYVVVRAGR